MKRERRMRIALSGPSVGLMAKRFILMCRFRSFPISKFSPNRNIWHLPQKDEKLASEPYWLNCLLHMDLKYSAWLINWDQPWLFCVHDSDHFHFQKMLFKMLTF